jgi:hypothetical protein
MEATWVTFLIDAVKSRVSLLLSEIAILDAQIPVFGTVPGTTASDSKIPALQRNIKATLCDLGSIYCNKLVEFEGNPGPLKNAIACHLVAIRMREFQILLHELQGHQSALTTLAGQEYMNATRNVNSSTDLHLKMGCLIFPYEFIFELLNEANFMNVFLSTVLRYSIDTHTRSVAAIFKLIKGRESLRSFANRNQFFTNSDTVIFSLAEHFIAFFAHDRMLRYEWLPLRNFSASEKAALLVAHGVANCGLNPEIVQRLGEPPLQPPESAEDDLPYLRPVKAPVPPLVLPELEVPAVLLVVLELKRLPLQISPTLIVNTLATALDYLSKTLTSDGSAVGADEIFQFFVYSLAAAKLRCLHGLTIMVEKFVHHSLRETRANYLMTQLVSGFEFIDNRMLPVQPYLLFPFQVLPQHLAGALHAVPDGKVVLAGFAVFAFPCWSAQRTEFFPALLRYTGEDMDVAVCYQFQTENPAALLVTDDMMRSGSVETAPAPQGTFFSATPKLIGDAWMIKVDGGDFDAEMSAVDAMSVLMLMGAGKIENPSTSMIPGVYQAVREAWRLRAVNPLEGVRLLIAEMQHGLALMGKIDGNGAVTGILDRRTLLSLQNLFYGNGGKFRFTIDMVDYIKKQVFFLTSRQRK